MKRQHLWLCAAALGLVIVGALAVGVPASTLLFLAVVLACPAMMLFMHGGHAGHGGQAGQDQHTAHRGHAGAAASSDQAVDASDRRGAV